MSSSAVDLLEGPGVEQTLDRVEALFGARVAAEAESFVLAAHFADLHPAETVGGGSGAGRVLRGSERAVQLGGVGTPLVAEFACLELGARMQMGSWSSRRYVADALDVRHRLPACWGQVVSGRARIPWVRLVASRTRHLSVQAAAVVDAAMADLVDGSLAWGRFETRLTGVVVAADPVVAAEREAARVEEQFAKRTRSSEDGTAGFYVRSSIGVIARLDATVAFVADALSAFGDVDPVEVRRVKAVLVLANPTEAVQLLAAYAAHRSRTLDVEADVPGPTDAADEGAAGPAGPETALDRMDGFARRVGFTPRRLPDWLTVRDPADPEHLDRPPGGPPGGPPGDPPSDPPGDPGGDPPGDAGRTSRFAFDWSRLLPTLTLNLHVADETVTRDSQGVVRWEGEGPVTLRHLDERLAPYHRFTVQPVIDLAAMAPVDAYELPDRHRRAVRLRSPASAAPFCADLTPVVDADHTEPYDPALSRGVRRTSGPPAWTTSPRSAGSTTGSRPTADGRSDNPSPASWCGETRTDRSTSSTTPAPTRSPDQATPPDQPPTTTPTSTSTPADRSSRSTSAADDRSPDSAFGSFEHVFDPSASLAAWLCS